MKNCNLFILGVALITATVLCSCRREDDTLARILVVDSEGKAVENAMVRMYATPTLDSYNALIHDDTLYTNADGHVIFNYTDYYNLGQAGFAVLDIMCRKDDEMLFGEGQIKVIEEETSEATVIIFP